MIRRSFLKFFGAGAAGLAAGAIPNVPSSAASIFPSIASGETIASLVANADLYPGDTWRLEEKMMEDPLLRIAVVKLRGGMTRYQQYYRGMEETALDPDIRSMKSSSLSTKFRMQADRRIAREDEYLKNLKKLIGL